VSFVVLVCNRSGGPVMGRRTFSGMRTSELETYMSDIRVNFANVDRMDASIQLNRYEPWDRRSETGRFEAIRYSVPTELGRFNSVVKRPGPMYVIVNLPRIGFMRKMSGAFYLVDDGQTIVPMYVAAYRNEQPGAINPYTHEPLDHAELDPSVVLHPVKVGSTDWSPRMAYHVTIRPVRQPGERVVKRVGS
jgi:hypothetical protein